MHEHDISNNHRHNTLVCASTKTTDYPRSDKAWIAGGECLPDIGQDTHQPTYQNRWTSTENVAKWNNDEIRVSKCDCRSSKQIIDLREGFVELLHEDWCQRSNGKGRENADKDEKCLVENHCRFPSCTPIL